jgi:excisionase family DNA binding protein
VDRSPPRPGLLRPAEVAAILRVAPRTVARWAAQGRLGVVRTPGGHRRYVEDDVIDLLDATRRTSGVGEPVREAPGPTRC